MLKSHSGSFSIDNSDANKLVLKIKNGTIEAQFTLDMSRTDIPVVVKSTVAQLARTIKKHCNDKERNNL